MNRFTLALSHFAMDFYRIPDTSEWLLVALFGVLVLYYLMKRRYVAKQLTVRTSSALWFKTLLRFTYMALIAAGLPGPSFGSKKEEVKAIGKDIFIAIDLSNSMNAEDIPPTRIEKVKFEMKKLMKEFNGDRIGIIIFSADAVMQCPLTSDGNMLNMLVNNLSTGQMNSGGTDFAPPLRLALEKHQKEESTQEKKSKIIILISDGEDFGEEAQDVADEIENEGIRLFTLGIGTEKGGRVPRRSGRGFKKNDDGDVVVSKLNNESLVDLAEQTGGEYFEISNQRNDTERLISSIRKIEGEVRDVKQVDAEANRYYYFLAAALLLLLADAVTSFRIIRF